MSSENEALSHAAWTELHEKFRAPLFAFFLKRVQNRNDAEDLTQEAFVRLTLRPDRNNGQTMHAYVFTIASNLVKDHNRFRHSRRTSAHRSLTNVLENSAAALNLVEDRDPERVLIGKEALGAFMGALAELPERTRDIFVLSRLEGMHQRDIAKIYDVSVSAVEKHVLRAQAHFAARFKQP